MRFELDKSDPFYPPSLKETEEPPSKLWVSGERESLSKGYRIAIVGSRKPTRYGEKVAYDLAYELALRRIIVVSGLAYGIDRQAHEGALAAGGKTIAVLGCGLDYPYPKKNLDLKERIANAGAVLSEFSPETAAISPHFPRRNRIISALSLGVIVVEAAVRSGALSTTAWGLSQGKEIFAVPGNITSPLSAGTNRLIQNGATPVLQVEDVLEALSLSHLVPHLKERQNFSPEEKIVEVLGEIGEASVDEIRGKTGLPISQLTALLVSLEICGKIAQLPGGRYRTHG
ncbi:MAG: DNA-protecting protein DprA [Deltaproteobacteria bacterium]|nr:DNA-protecting protein DprA [Deltaproteobacteria bacterium]